jgi:uncharacterized phage-associated protein
MKFVFNERKAAEAAAHLLLLGGGRMPYMSLLKLLYLADRRTLVETGFTITGDKLVSMDHGTNLSTTYDRAQQEHPIMRTAWSQYVGPAVDKSVQLVQPPPDAGALSRYEIRVLGEVHAEHGHRTQWELERLTHDLPEWRNPHGSSKLIDPADILKHELKSDKKVAWRVKLAEGFYEFDKQQVQTRK